MWRRCRPSHTPTTRCGWRGFAGAALQNPPLAAAIEQRHTDRRFPWRGPITADAQTRLDAQAQLIPGQRLYWPQTSTERTAARSVIRRAETLRFNSPTLHAELFSSIRFAAGWHAASEEGLAPATLAVEAPLRPVFQAARGNEHAQPAGSRLGAGVSLGLAAHPAVARAMSAGHSIHGASRCTCWWPRVAARVAGGHPRWPIGSAVCGGRSPQPGVCTH